MLVYPSTIRAPIRANYSRVETPMFDTTDPASGSYFVQINSDDSPTYFNLSFIFERESAMVFRAWLLRNNKDLLNGAQFEIDLSTESGDTTQVASFTQDGIPQYTGETTNLVYYSAKILVRRFFEPITGNEDLILGVAELGGANLLDVIVNIDMPRI